LCCTPISPEVRDPQIGSRAAGRSLKQPGPLRAACPGPYLHTLADWSLFDAWLIAASPRRFQLLQPCRNAPQVHAPPHRPLWGLLEAERRAGGGHVFARVLGFAGGPWGLGPGFAGNFQRILEHFLRFGV
jgi:hypothetical protein